MKARDRSCYCSGGKMGYWIVMQKKTHSENLHANFIQSYFLVSRKRTCFTQYFADSCLIVLNFIFISHEQFFTFTFTSLKVFQQFALWVGLSWRQSSNVKRSMMSGTRYTTRAQLRAFVLLCHKLFKDYFFSSLSHSPYRKKERSHQSFN